MKAWLLDLIMQLADDCTEAETGAKIIRIKLQFATPVVVTELTSFQHGISNQSRLNNLG